MSPIMVSGLRTRGLSSKYLFISSQNLRFAAASFGAYTPSTESGLPSACFVSSIIALPWITSHPCGVCVTGGFCEFQVHLSAEQFVDFVFAFQIHVCFSDHQDCDLLFTHYLPYAKPFVVWVVDVCVPVSTVLAFLVRGCQGSFGSCHECYLALRGRFRPHVHLGLGSPVGPDASV
ncbi:unnamed protein product, partial [Mycena citricolor]